MKEMVMTASIGGNKTKAHSPYMPTTFDEVIADGVKSFRAGAAQLHVHGRNRAGEHTFDPVNMQELIETFRAECPGVVVQISAGDTYHAPQELLVPLLKLQPDLLSLAVQETEEETIALIRIFDEYGVRPVVECFDMEKARQACHLFRAGYFEKKPLNLELVFEGEDKGRPFSALAAELMELDALCSGEAIEWSICGGDKHEAATQALAIALGGHVRTGLEDHYRNSDGAFFTESLCTVLPALQLCQLLGRTAASPQRARELLGV